MRSQPTFKLYDGLSDDASSGENQTGTRVLVTAAGGAVGTALLQLGKVSELEIVATVSTQKIDLVKAEGAIPIDYTRNDFAQVYDNHSHEGFDAVFDCTTAANFNSAYSALRANGTLVWYGMQLQHESMLDKLLLPLRMMFLFARDRFSRQRNLEFYSIADLRNKEPGWFREDLAELMQLLRQKRIKPVIDERLPLEKARKAHEKIEHGEVRGKLILTVGE